MNTRNDRYLLKFLASSKHITAFPLINSARVSNNPFSYVDVKCVCMMQDECHSQFCKIIDTRDSI
jgi:hypothetical protein